MATEQEEYMALKEQTRDILNQAKVDRERGLIDIEISKAIMKFGLKKDTYVALLDRSLIKVEGDKVAGVDKAFEALKADNPDFFIEPEIKGGGGDKSPKHGEVSDFVTNLIKETEEHRKPAWPANWKD